MEQQEILLACIICIAIAFCIEIIGVAVCEITDKLCEWIDKKFLKNNEQE